MKNSQGYYETELIVNSENMNEEIGFYGDYMEEVLSQFKGSVKIYIK
jgi:DNA polymerase III sliding clamp (beta) subunit (PCNA family)